MFDGCRFWLGSNVDEVTAQTVITQGDRHVTIYAAAAPGSQLQHGPAARKDDGNDQALHGLGRQPAPEGQAGRRREARGRRGAPYQGQGRQADGERRPLCRSQGRGRSRGDRPRLPASHPRRHQLGGDPSDRGHGAGKGGRELSAALHKAPVQKLVDSLARDSASRLVAALARRLGAGRIAVAEDAVQHALLQALSSWPFKGVPARPEAWLAVVARNCAMDLLRHEARGLALADELLPFEPRAAEREGHFDRELSDDELALLFAVCHPVLSPDVRVTFALKTVCGLTVPQIASGLLSEPTAIAQRLVRARRQLESARVAIEAPPPEALAERAESVRTALYLMFNEGYSASSGEALVQPEFCVEAVRLARALAQHPMTMSPASDALAALLALTAARLPTRVGPDGVAQLLEDQPRAEWDGGLIVLGLAHLERSARGDEL